MSKDRRTKAELKEIAADKAYWEEVTALCPVLKLYGWTYRIGASFYIEGAIDYGLINLSGVQRDIFVQSLKEQKQMYIDNAEHYA